MRGSNAWRLWRRRNDDYIEQAVEAVRRVQEVDEGYIRNEVSAYAIIAALRALQPAEPTEEVERVAEAIYQCDGSSYIFGANDDEERQPYIVKARAAIAAMRSGR